ncbi:MAG: YrhA family protein [Verrucomicrobium sp.]|nr:YrhA family protein [Verrucomicrobium sp.]
MMTDETLDLIEQVFEDKREGGYPTEPPAGPEALDGFRACAEEAGLGTLPEDWIDFLKQSDGLAWNGVTLFGLDQEDDEGEPYARGGLLEFNRRERPADKPASRYLLLGHTDVDYLAYDRQERIYLALSLADWSVSATYPDFAAFFQEQAEMMLGGEA